LFGWVSSMAVLAGGSLLKAGGSVGLIGGLIQRLRPVACLFFGFRLGYSIPLLNLPDQLILLARNRFPVIVQLSPPLAGRARELLPLVPNSCLCSRYRFPGDAMDRTFAAVYFREALERRGGGHVSSPDQMCIRDGKSCTPP
jgi:hypothetical protein